MPHDANQPKGWRGDGKQPKRAAKYGWKPKTSGVETPWLMRRATQIGLMLGILTCIAVVVGLFLLLRPPEDATIIIVGANPADDATNLQAPLDFHGWQGGSKLAHFIKEDVKYAEFKPEKDYPFTLTSMTLSQQLADLVKNSRKEIIIYFGLVGFAKDDGPYLFGAKGETIAVKTIIDTLAPIAEASQKDVILLFDAARMPVGPELGMLHNDFVRSLQEKLGEKIKTTSHLAVICSSSPDERAWNSDEWGCSVFLLQVLEALRGGAKNGNNHDIKLHDLFQYVKKQTEEWTGQRHVSKQTPILIVGQKMDTKNPKIVTQRETHIKLNEKESVNAPGYEWLTREDAGKPDQLKKLKSHLENANKLAQGKPHPAVYTPLSWRRYRELLVRLEQALRMKDDKAEGELSTELDRLRNSIEDAQGLKFKNVTATNTIWPKLLASPKPVEAAKEIVAGATKLTEPPKEAENHLAYMLDRFWKGRSADNSPSPELRLLAIDTRQLAERAALACSNEQSGHYYTERLWPWIEPKLKELDQQRRRAEDYLFSDDYAQAEKLLATSKQSYEDLLKKYVPLQSAMATYHQAVSEATYLTQWHVTCAEEMPGVEADRLKRMRDLWMHIHQLEKDLAKANLDSPAKELEGLKETCTTINLLMKQEMETFAALVKLNTGNPAITQAPRHQLELLLAFPWPIPSEGAIDNQIINQRLSAIIKARQAGDTLHKVDQRSITELKQKDWKNITKYRAQLIGYMLGEINTRASDYALELNSLDQADWQARANLLGKELALQWQLLATDGSKTQKRPTKLSDDQAEDYSRYTLAFQGVPEETALKRRNERWVTVLHDLARRICLDHWFDEKGAYYKKTAQLYLDDGQIESDKDPELKVLLEPRELKWLPDKELTWTSEQKRSWTISVENTLKNIQGQIAIWAEPKEAADASKPGKTPAVELDKEDQRRVSQPLVENSPTISRKLTFNAANASLAELARINLAFLPKAYFRGQEPLTEYKVAIHRRPSFIVTQHEPEDKGTFTLTAAKDLRVGLGQLAIVLDYSGSMRKSSVPDGKGDWVWRRDDSRIYQAIDGLNKMLLGLTDRVEELDISIRIFSENNAAAKEYPQLKPEKDPDYQQSVITQTNAIKSTLFCTGKLKLENGKCVFEPKDHPEQKESLARIIEKLKDIEPFYSTPLLKSMIDAKDTDARKSLADGETVTLLVLTDGADTSLGEINDLNDPKIEKLGKSFNTAFANSKLSIQMVLFTDQDLEKSIAEKQFKDLKSDNSRIVVRKAANYDDLVKELMASFQVKMQVTKDGRVVPSGEVGDQQYFIAQEENTQLGSLKYSPFLAGENFSRVWINDKQRLAFSGGDHLFIKLRNDANNKVRYSRELFADVWKRKIGGGNQFIHEDNSPWHLTVAESNPEGVSRGHLTVTLEDERTKESTKEQIPTLSMQRPKWVWWDVKAASESAKDKDVTGTVHITNRRYYLAPAWDIDKSPNQDENIRVQAWVSEKMPDEVNRWTFTRNELKKKENLLQYNNNQLSISVEEHRLIDACLPATEPTSCLVVRYRLPDKQRVQFSASGIRSLKRVDHHFFPEANTMTVYFSPFNVEDVQDEELILKLMNIDEYKVKLNKPTINALLPMNMNWKGPPISNK